MQFKIKQKDLMAMLEKVTPGLSQEQNIPFHGKILVETFQDGLSLSVFSGEITIKTFFSTPINENVAFGVSGKIFSDIIKSLSGDLTLSILDEANLAIKQGRKTLKTKITPFDQFPIAPKYEHMTFQPAEGLLASLDHVAYAMLSDDRDPRPQLKAAFVNEDEIVATNGHQLSVSKLPNPLNWSSKVLIPGTAIPKVKKVMGIGQVDVNLDESQIHFKSETTAMSVRTLAAEYPNYKRIIPDSGRDIVKIKKADLAEALKLVLLMSSDPKTSMHMTFAEGSLKLSANDSKNGHIEDIVDADCYCNFLMGMNATYLMDIVKEVKSDTISLEINNEVSPVAVREDGRIHIVMPQKLQRPGA